MTKDAKKVIEQGFMFRCNSAGATGNGLTPFENCLQYETEELGNANQHQVEAYYGDPDQKIELPDNVFVASDLGPEGVLVVAPIKSWREKI